MRWSTAGDINSQGVDYLYVIRREDLAGRPRRRRRAPRGPLQAPAAPARTDPLDPALAGGRMAGCVPAASTCWCRITGPCAGDHRRHAAVGRRQVHHHRRQAGAGRQPGRGGRPAAPAAAAPAAPAPAAGTPPSKPAAPPVAAPAPATAAPAAAGTQGVRIQEPHVAENTRIIRVPVTQLKNGDLRYNIVIRPQDMIIVPLPITGEYYIDGHVNRTGRLQPDRPQYHPEAGDRGGGWV